VLEVVTSKFNGAEAGEDGMCKAAIKSFSFSSLLTKYIGVPAGTLIMSPASRLNLSVLSSSTNPIMPLPIVIIIQQGNKNHQNE
jgi:hypothetical protein